MFLDLKWFKQYFLCSNQFSWRKSQEFALCGGGGGGDCGEKEILYIKTVVFLSSGHSPKKNNWVSIKAKELLPLITIGLALGP